MPTEMEIIVAEMIAGIESGEPDSITYAKKLAQSFFDITGKDIYYKRDGVSVAVKDLEAK